MSRLIVEVGANVARLQRDMNRMTGTVDTAAKRMKRMFAGVGFALAGAFSVRGIHRSITSFLSMADAVGKASDKVGVGVEALQEFRHAAELSGVQVRTADMALQRFSRRMGEAAQGTGEALKVVEKYGIQVRDSNGAMRSNMDIMDDWAEVIKNAESEQEALRIAFKLFDSEGAAMVNMIRDGKDAFGAMREEARELGSVMDSRMVRAAEEVNNQFTRLRRRMEGAKIGIMQTLMPALEVLAEQLIEIAEYWSKIFGGTGDPDIKEHEKRIAGINRELEKSRSLLDKLSDKDFPGDPSQSVREVQAHIAVLETRLKLETETLERLREQKEEQEKAARSAKTLKPGVGEGGVIDTKGQADKDQKHLDERMAAIRKIVDLETQADNELALLKLEGHRKELAALEQSFEAKKQLYEAAGADITAIEEMYQVERQKIFESEVEGIASALREEAREREEIEASLTDKTKSLTLDRRDYQIWALGEETKALREKYENDKEMLDRINEYHRAAMENMTEESAKAFDYLEEFSRQTAQSMQGAFSDFFYNSMTGELDSLEDRFRRFGDAVLRILSDVLAKQAAVGMFGKDFMSGSGDLGGIAGSLISGVTSLFGGGGSGIEAGSLIGAESAGFTWFHGGGIAGGSTRPESVFRDAPRLHDGLAPDEYPAILQKGEGVFTDGQMKALGGAISRPEKEEPRTVNVNIFAADAKSVADMMRRNPEAVLGPLVDELEGGNTKLRTAIREGTQ